MQIGNVEIKNRLILAPMTGIASLEFRLRCKRYGAGLTCIGAICADRVAENNSSELININNRRCITSYEENPVMIQLCGSNIENIINSARLVKRRANILDFNLGCPVTKILKKGSGAALLKKPEKIRKILVKLVKSVNIPVTAKIRSGINEADINAVEIAKLCEDAGVVAITVHARTLKQGFSGKPNWDVIRKVKQNVNIPVIGNGGIRSAIDVKNMLDYTNCDFVMVGTATINNPFIFYQASHYLKTKKLLSKSVAKYQIKRNKNYEFFNRFKLLKFVLQKYSVLSYLSIRNLLNPWLYSYNFNKDRGKIEFERGDG